MGRVLTNNVALNYTVESALGVAGTSWFALEPNAINTFGAAITTVARSPISANRQRRKGTVTDLDSAVDFEADITLSAFRDFIEGFCFSSGINSDVTELAATAAETTGDTYTIAALSAAQANKFEIDTLIWAEGFTNAGNNGLKVIDTDAVATDTTLAVANNLVDEASPPASARLSFAGHRIAALDAPTWTYAAPLATLALTGIGTELAALGLTPGQFVHFGSIATEGSTTIQNAWQQSVANDGFGWARVRQITNDAVVFDKLDAALKFTDAAIATAVDILFGEFIRNVATSDADYLERSFQFEAAYPNLDTGGGTMYSYAKGNFCNEVQFQLPLTDKAVATFGFIGTDTDNPVSAGSRKAGASSAATPNYTSAFNTSSEIARLRITDTDEAGLTTDFKDLTFTINNNVSPEKVLGTLGAAYINTGGFDIGFETQLVFTNADVVARIRENTSVTMDFILKNADGCIAFDIPSLSLGDGSLDFPVNESVLINTTGAAEEDGVFGTSLGISICPVPLP